MGTEYLQPDTHISVTRPAYYRITATFGELRCFKYHYFGHGGLQQMVLAGNAVLCDLLGTCRSGRLWWMVSLVFVPFSAFLELIRQGIDPYIMIYTSISRICGEFRWTFHRRHKKAQEYRRHCFNGARICQIIEYFITHFKVLGLYFMIA